MFNHTHVTDVDPPSNLYVNKLVFLAQTTLTRFAFFFTIRTFTLDLTIYTIICLKYVAVRKRQVAILARSPQEMSQTDRIVWKHILSRVRVSVRPRICFIREKTPNLSLIQSRPHGFFFNGSPTGHCLASVESGAPNHDGLIGRTNTANSDGRGWGWVCACSRVWAGVRVRACMRACAMCLQYTIMIFYPGW